MPIDFACTSCQKKINAPDAAAGKRAKCPFCQAMQQIPAATVPAPVAATSTPRKPQKPVVVDRWLLLADDGEEYGPVSRAELDGWFEEGLITSTCQILREGSHSWQFAPDLFPQLPRPPKVEKLAPIVDDSLLDLPVSVAAPQALSRPVAAPKTVVSAPQRQHRPAYSSSYSSSERSDSVTNAAYACYAVAGIMVIRLLIKAGLHGWLISKLNNVGIQSNEVSQMIAANIEMIVKTAAISLALAIPYFIAGLGVSGRRQWGRILALVLGLVSILVGIVFLCLTWGEFHSYLLLLRFGMRLPPDTQAWIMFGIGLNAVTMIVWFAHAVINYTVLLSGRSAQEFR